MFNLFFFSFIPLPNPSHLSKLEWTTTTPTIVTELEVSTPAGPVHINILYTIIEAKNISTVYNNWVFETWAETEG